MFRSIDQLGARVLIDCGHIGVRAQAEGFVLGLDGVPSPTQLQTLELGLDLAQRLRATGREARLGICLSDTTRQLQELDGRALLRQRCAEGRIPALLPGAYTAAFQAAGFDPDGCHYSLQTQNSNHFSKILKQVKRELRRPEATLEGTYARHQALFLDEGDLFGFTTAFLLDPEPEVRALGGRRWLDEAYTPTERDLRKAPLLRVKRQRVVNLFSRASGILCPATYGGLLLGAAPTFDHIAIYARADDPFIGEKVLRGVIAAHAVSPSFGGSCLVVTLPELSEQPEVCLLDRRQLRAEVADWGELLRRYEASGLGERWKACA